MVALFKQMEALYSFADDVQGLPGKIQQLEHIIVRVLEQTTECGIFFREYTESGFLGQCINNPSKFHAFNLMQRSIFRAGSV